MYKMLAEYGGKMRPDDEVVLQDLKELVNAYVRSIEESQKYVDANKQTHVAATEAKVADMFDDLKNVFEQCRSGIFDTGSSDPAHMCKKLARLSQQVRTHRWSGLQSIALLWCVVGWLPPKWLCSPDCDFGVAIRLPNST
jgi:hypothetical protein